MAASNLHGGACLSQFGGPLQEVHQRVCTHCTTTQQVSYWGRGPFLLETDVSKDGLDAVLMQKQADGQYHPIAYGSRVLTPHEKKLPLN